MSVKAPCSRIISLWLLGIRQKGVRTYAVKKLCCRGKVTGGKFMRYLQEVGGGVICYLLSRVVSM